ncbi:gallidermin/nisin family lantibiotic [Clostridium botulinum]|nr:gallidermin/nisin family lantibiotic [Clostridium botulinum]NFA01363.1 gallidermin/nisin family lantibiotic [Clostridium botulinum]NFA33040.1 gallidermin/nisin family lantibiotic [Clostridium botulinum]NFA87003.1 gallidermin/nisin family lantibiotic [Clostridium botulinum]NFA91978.1 gallidermin/nisin family lantibiotic [Clostridium botulinum]
MGKFDDFDLDVNVNKGNEKQSRIFSISLCTPGTCKTCNPPPTLESNCCPDTTRCHL